MKTKMVGQPFCWLQAGMVIPILLSRLLKHDMLDLNHVRDNDGDTLP